MRSFNLCWVKFTLEDSATKAFLLLSAFDVSCGVASFLTLTSALGFAGSAFGSLVTLALLKSSFPVAFGFSLAAGFGASFVGCFSLAELEEIAVTLEELAIWRNCSLESLT